MLRYPSLLTPQSLQQPKLLQSTTRLSFRCNPASRRCSASTAARGGSACAACAAVAEAPRWGTMYDLLSVSQTAGFDEIKAAFKRQARQWHPDTCRSPDEKGYFAQRFMEAREAYLVLSDPVLREDYDYKLRTGRGVDSLDGSLFSRKGRGGASARRQGFVDWEAQMETLRRRSAARDQDEAEVNTWGSRMRRTNRDSFCTATL